MVSIAVGNTAESSLTHSRRIAENVRQVGDIEPMLPVETTEFGGLL
jgi:hypothetical protein